MNIGVVLITYAIDVTPLIRSIDGRDVSWHIYTHSDRPEALACLGMSVQGESCFHDCRQNRGLAKSWNDGLIEAYDQGAATVVIANDDLVMTHNDLLVLAQAAVEHPECGIIVAEGYNVRMDEQQQLQFAVPAINRSALEQIGYFDESYTPIYGEDCDYSRRAALLGVKFYNAGKTDIIHTGSATVGSVPDLALQNNKTFQANLAYHIAKHGGSYGSESFAFPFNDPGLSWKITAENRHNPYPGHERTDLEIVKL